MKSVLLCIGILALAGTENADLRIQDDFRRGKKIANLSTCLPFSTSYVALMAQDFSKYLSTLPLSKLKYLSQASILEDASHQIAQFIKNKI